MVIYMVTCSNLLVYEAGRELLVVNRKIYLVSPEN